MHLRSTIRAGLDLRAFGFQGAWTTPRSMQGQKTSASEARRLIHVEAPPWTEPVPSGSVTAQVGRTLDQEGSSAGNSDSREMMRVP